MKNIILIFSIIAIPILILCFEIDVEHIPYENFNYGEKIYIKIDIKTKVRETRIYFKYDGIEQSQIRNMEKKNSSYIYELDTSLYAPKNFQYYFEMKINNEMFYFPEGAPENTFNITAKNIEEIPEIPQGIPSPQEEEASLAFPMDLNGDLEHRIAEKEQTEEKKTNASGNIRIYPSYQREGKISIYLDSNFSMTDNPLPEEEKVDLSNMTLKFEKNNNSLNFGDLNINESEYSVYGLGRRGIDWLYDSKKVYLHLFDISSQQPKGFKGFGIPKSNISIFGSVFGYKFFDDKFLIKTIYLSGKDDPGEGVNIDSSELYQRRKGSVIAIIEEAKLINNKLSIKSEFAKSKYDDNFEDEEGSASDKAYKAGVDFSSGSFFFGINYNYIGKDFNPIGYQFFSNDRKGYSSVLGFNLGVANIQTSFNSEEDNVENDPQRLKTKNNRGNLSFSTNLSQRVSLNIAYSKGKQKTYQNSEEVPGQDSKTKELTGSISFNVKNNSNIIFSVASSSLSSEFMPENESNSLNANLGGFFRAGNFFTINPLIGYSLSKNEFTNEETKTYNTFISGEFYFIPSILYLNFTAGYNKSLETNDFEAECFNTNTGINFDLGSLIKKFQAILSLKGNYLKNKTNGLETSNYKAFIQLSFSF